MVPISDAWFTSFLVRVRRYEGTVSNYTETGDFEDLYDELPTSIHGEASTVENTIAGSFGLGASSMIWRSVDIDPEKGWPQEDDVVIYQGRAFLINRIEDHTAIPPMFKAVVPHKVAHLGEEIFREA